MIDNIAMMIDQVGEVKAIKALSIAGQESSFGTNGYIAINCNNYFGYLYHGTEKRGCYSEKWDTPTNGIARFLKIEENDWLESETYDGYCVSDCTTWDSGVAYFNNVLTEL